MRTMRAIVLITCVISILSGVLDALKPDQKFDRQLRLLLAAIFLLGILTPLGTGAAKLQFEIPDESSFSDTTLDETVSQQTLEQAQLRLETALEELLRENGLEHAQVTAEMYISAEDCIEIEQVTVFCADAAAAKPILESSLGSEVEIQYVETDCGDAAA